MMALSSLRLTVLAGPTRPGRLPGSVIDALVSVEVDSRHDDVDVFRLTFAPAKRRGDLDLLTGDVFRALNRVRLVVAFGIRSQVLIDGVVTHHQVRPSNTPGESMLVVSGDDLSAHLTLADRPGAFDGRTDSQIVTEVLDPYLKFGLKTDVTAVSRKPGATERHRVRTTTDLDFLRYLAEENGFRFAIVPDDTGSGDSTARWGPVDDRERQEPDLTMNMGSLTTVDQPLAFRFDMLGPVKPTASVPETADSSVTVGAAAGAEPGLARVPAAVLRETYLYRAAGLTRELAELRATQARLLAADAVTVVGELDLGRYGALLRPRRRIRVRGVGRSYDGDYAIRQVSTMLRRGSATQSFGLARDGLDAPATGGA